MATDDKIEVSFSVDILANLHIWLSPGTKVTAEILEEAVERFNAFLENDDISAGNAVFLSAQVLRRDSQVPIRTYNPDTGEDGEIEIGDTI